MRAIALHKDAPRVAVFKLAKKGMTPEDIGASLQIHPKIVTAIIQTLGPLSKEALKQTHRASKAAERDERIAEIKAENPDEIWAEVEGYEGLYEVSDLGRVLSIRRAKVLSNAANAAGYLVVELYDAACETSMKYVHRLVGEAFLPADASRALIHHIDHDKANPVLDNLTRANQSENYWAYREWKEAQEAA
jgi:hypothetical protein